MPVQCVYVFCMISEYSEQSLSSMVRLVCVVQTVSLSGVAFS